MKIRIYVKDMVTGTVLEELGTCVCDSPSRAVEMYQDEEDMWDDKGYCANIAWTTEEG